MKKSLFLLLTINLIFILALSGCKKAEEPVKEAEEISVQTEKASETAEDVSEETPNPLPEWGAYDALIKDIKTTSDFSERVKRMHEAEDMLMETGAVLPLYYYNNYYMKSSKVKGFYASLYGTNYWLYAEKEDDTTLRINLASEPDTLDPALNRSKDGSCLAVNSFGGLYYYADEDHDPSNPAVLAPFFAESYELSEDGLIYTFKLKEGLKWSDGSDLTASDFVYSWNRAADPKTAAGNAYLFDIVAGFDEVQEGTGKLQVSAPDALTLVVNLEHPCAYFLDLTAMSIFFPVKQSEVEKPADWETNPGSWCRDAGFISSGAFMLESWNHDESMIYVKNPYFFDADKVKIERVELMLSADDTAVFMAYRAGDLDFFQSIPIDEIENLKDKDPEFYITDRLGTYYVCFNVKSSLFEGKTVEQANAMRRAFSKLVDREYIIDTVAQCGQKPATSFIPSGMADGNGGVFKDAANWNYPVADGYYETDVDVEGAIELLKEAGFEFTQDGLLSAETPISFEFLTDHHTTHEAAAECIQQDLAAIGINMTIKVVDWNVFIQERRAGNYDIARNGWSADFNDPINMLEMWTTNSGNNDIQFGR